MVPANRYLVALGLWGLLSSCVSTENEFGSRIIGSATPVLVSADPEEAPRGATVDVIGTGFSIAAPENVFSLGGAAVPASQYAVDEEGNQVLTFEIPPEAPEGEQTLFVIVGQTPSNALTFTVTP